MPKHLLQAFLFVLLFVTSAHAGVAALPVTQLLTQSENRVASLFVAEDFLNQLLAERVKSELIKDVKVTFDAERGQVYLRGKLQVPVEELRAVNLDPKLGAFRFQVTIKLEASKKGYLILEFPLSETYFYPADSKDPARDRVIVPVQMLSLALASVRGYLAALSGDFSGFDRRTKKLTALIKGLDRIISTEKNPDALEDLKNQRDGLRLQLAAVPIERKQLQSLAKEVAHMMGFMGEKELNLNDELGARKNALIFKIKLSQLAPYLSGVELGGVRLVHDKKDGHGENYLAIDINSLLISVIPPSASAKAASANRAGMAVAPSLVIRLNQSLFESVAVVEAERKQVGTKIRDLVLQLKEDGLHMSGKYHTFLFTLPFDAVIDFVTTGPDVFEVRVRNFDIAGLDLEFMTRFMLQAVEKRLEHALVGLCTFNYVGEEKDHSRALEVKVNSKMLVPAFPDLHLVDVEVRDREFLLKIGRP